MKKIEFIEKYGQAAYDNRLVLGRAWHEKNREKHKSLNRRWRKENSEKVRELYRVWREGNSGKIVERNREINRKGGKFYEKKLKYQQTGIPGERAKTRTRHANKWRQYKNIIAPDSQLHHQWVPNTAEYTGLALVEKDQHQHGVINVIQILEGNITLFTEKEVRGGEFETE